MILEIAIGIPLALLILFILFRVISTAIFISWWEVKVRSIKKIIKQLEKEE